MLINLHFDIDEKVLEYAVNSEDVITVDGFVKTLVSFGMMIALTDVVGGECE